MGTYTLSNEDFAKYISRYSTICVSNSIYIIVTDNIIGCIWVNKNGTPYLTYDKDNVAEILRGAN